MFFILIIKIKNYKLQLEYSEVLGSYGRGKKLLWIRIRRRIKVRKFLPKLWLKPTIRAYWFDISQIKTIKIPQSFQYIRLKNN